MRTQLVSVLLAFSLTAIAQDIQVPTADGVRKAALHYPILPRALYPTVIGLHGGGGNREEFLNDALIDHYTKPGGMLLVLAEGTGAVSSNGNMVASWNAGRCCGPAYKNNVDDVAYLRSLIDLLVSKYRADPSRIYLFGFSNGAKMTYRAACELSDKIRAVATVGGVGVFDSAPGAHDRCPLSRPVPTLHIHGGEDSCSPAAGGDVGNCFFRYLELVTGEDYDDSEIHVSLEPATTFFHWWSGRMGFAHYRNEPSVTGHRCRSYGKTALSPRMNRICMLDGVGHVWPGGRYGTPCALGTFSRSCRAWREVVAGSRDGIFSPYSYYKTSQEILNFFNTHR